MTRDPLIGEFLAFAEGVAASSRAELAFDRSIRAAALSRVGNRDVRSAALRARDAEIAAFRAWWCAELGAADGAFATACAWPGTEGARCV